MKKRFEKLGQIFKRFKIENVCLSPTSSSLSISYTNYDAEAAWILYVELLTRIATQPLEEKCGVEKCALDSIYSIFGITREVLKIYGRNAKSFTKIAIVVLNQIIRPFTSKWHAQLEAGCFNDEEKCLLFRCELETLRKNLLKYSSLLAEMARVDDLTDIH